MTNNGRFDLKGKTALVTGGAKGIGFAIAQAMRCAGANVIIVGRNEDELKNACSTLGERSSYYVFDLADTEKIPAFIAKLEAINGIDILVNNAGLNMKKEMLDVEDKEYEQIIKVNQQAVFVLSREVARSMIAKGNGSIIMISSMAAHYGLPKVIAYTASKSAVEGMTRAMAAELSPKGVRVNCIAPGFIATDMSSKALNGDPERKTKVLSRTPLGKLGKPEDVGHAAVYLASEEAGFITAVVLPVDGGNSIGF